MRNPVTPRRASAHAWLESSQRLLVLSLVTLGVSACAWTTGSNPPQALRVAPPRGSSPVPAPPAALSPSLAVFAEPLLVRVIDKGGTRIVAIPVDQYVAGCVRAELLPTTSESDSATGLMGVQAIVSRTYALANRGRHAAEGFDLCDGTHCQLYRALAPGVGRDLAAQAVAATENQVITYGGKPIQALFHSNCGGHTADAEAVWGGPGVPYLRPATDEFCVNAPGSHWEFSASTERLRDILNGEPRTAVGTRLDRIEVSERDAAGRAVLIVASGERSPMVRAEEFRSVLRRAFGPRSLKSTWFSVSRRGNDFVFAGVGYGHGVGLCQAGAALRALGGHPAAAIIAHYFPGTRLESLATSHGPQAGPAGTFVPWTVAP
jgi:stage II sporulation protein D